MPKRPRSLEESSAPTSLNFHHLPCLALSDGAPFLTWPESQTINPIAHHQSHQPQSAVIDRLLELHRRQDCGGFLRQGDHQLDTTRLGKTRQDDPS